MKKLYLLFALFLSLFFIAQVPQGFSYQAIAFNSAGQPVVNGNISVRISIIDNTATGAVLYTETHSKATNSKGLVNLNIGQGVPNSGSFSGINWALNPKFIKVEIDPTGGSNYISVGVNQLMSVPYAMVAGNVNINNPGSTLNDDIVENKSSNFIVLDTSNDTIYSYNGKIGTWSQQKYLTGSYNPTVTASNGGFIVLDTSNYTIYAYNGKTGTWSQQKYLTGSYNPTVTASNGSFIVLDKSNNTIYAYNGIIGTWSQQKYLTGSYNPTVTASNGSFIVLDTSNDTIYAYNGKTGTWSQQKYLTGSYNPTVTASNGGFIVLDTSNYTIYAYNGKTGTWSQQKYLTGSYTPTITTSESN